MSNCSKLGEWMVSKTPPREVSQAAIECLEGEWRQFFQNEMHGAQPVAETLYDSFHFLPPWLPKPWNRMIPEEQEQIQKIVRLVRQSKEPLDFVRSWGLRFEGEQKLREDTLMNVLNLGRGRCVGLSHVFYFAQAIVLGKRAQFSDVYRGPKGERIDHVGVVMAEKFYDPSYGLILGANYLRFELTPMDAWALALLNVAAVQETSPASPAEIEETYRRAQELAPHYFRVQYNLGIYLFEHGEWDEGIALLRAAHATLPLDADYPKYLDYFDQLDSGF